VSLLDANQYQDHYLIKKPAYYSIKRALEPIALGVSRTLHDWSKKVMDPMLTLGQVDPTLDAKEDTKFDVWMVNSHQRSLEAQVNVRFISIRSGEDVLPAVTTSVKLEANATTEAMSEALKPLNPDLARPDAAFDVDKYDPYIIWAAASIDDKVISQDVAWPQPLKYINFPENRGLGIEWDGDKSLLIFSADKPVKGLVLEETRGTRLGDNNLDVVPGRKYMIKVGGSAVPQDMRFTYVGAPTTSLSVAHYLADPSSS
jgi:beta-mannosidase